MATLHVEKGKIMNRAGNPVFLRGVNTGGWLLMEGYIMGGRNIPEHRFKQSLARAHGSQSVNEFEGSFRKTFITEDDFRQIKSWQLNCVRVPFHYRIFEDDASPFIYKQEGVQYFKKILKWARKYSLYILFDMHAVSPFL